jgi:elongation factor Ts
MLRNAAHLLKVTRLQLTNFGSDRSFARRPYFKEGTPLMAEITAKMVGQLREETGAGMMDCKKALAEANGEMEEARTILRKKGAAKAGVKSETRTASEGIIESFVTEDGLSGSLVELNSETDFVARNEEFRALAAKLAKQVATTTPAYKSVDEFLAAPSAVEAGKNVQETITDTIARLGEKIAVARFERYDVPQSGGSIGTYIHKTDYKTGVLVLIEANKPVVGVEAVSQLGKDLAMHVAAARPAYVGPDEAPAEAIAKEREIAKAKQDADPAFASKPEGAKTAMIEGQIRKYLEQYALTEQAFVKDSSGKLKIKGVVAEAAKQAGAALKILGFVRYRVGETHAQSEEAANV